MKLHPLKWYHKVGGFVCGKACVGVLSIPTYPTTTITNLSSQPTTPTTTILHLTPLSLSLHATTPAPQYSLKMLYSLIRQEKHTQTILLYHNVIKSRQKRNKSLTELCYILRYEIAYYKVIYISLIYTINNNKKVA